MISWQDTFPSAAQILAHESLGGTWIVAVPTPKDGALMLPSLALATIRLEPDGSALFDCCDSRVAVGKDLLGTGSVAHGCGVQRFAPVLLPAPDAPFQPATSDGGAGT